MTKQMVLEATDPDTGCIVEDSVFTVDDLEYVKKTIDPNGTEDEFNTGYEIGPEEALALIERFQFEFSSLEKPLSLRVARPNDTLPYKIHTNRELRMMLDGKKPFAYFAEEYPLLAETCIPEDRFAPYVSDGRIIKREYIFRPEPNSEAKDLMATRYVLYALKEEQWRIEAFIMLQRTAQRSGWNEGFERFLGSLLGYSDWENDVHIAVRREWQAKHKISS